MDFREEALEKLKHNNVSAVTMEIWIAGYITGREENDRLRKEKWNTINLAIDCPIVIKVNEFVPEGEYTSDGYGYTQFKDL